jgi:hypothetical protein
LTRAKSGRRRIRESAMPSRGFVVECARNAGHP